MAMLLAAPFRLVYLHAFPRADYGAARCYVTGQRGTDVLLFCPDAAPRTRVIDGNDPEFTRRSDVESIFTRPGTSSAR